MHTSVKHSNSWLCEGGKSIFSFAVYLLKTRWQSQNGVTDAEVHITKPLNYRFRLFLKQDLKPGNQELPGRYQWGHTGLVGEVTSQLPPHFSAQCDFLFLPLLPVKVLPSVQLLGAPARGDAIWFISHWTKPARSLKCIQLNFVS